MKKSLWALMEACPHNHWIQIKMKPKINNDEDDLNALTFTINGCAMEVLNSIGHGLHEKTYENALALLLKEKGISLEQQKEYKIIFKEKIIGTFIPDLVVNNQVIVELKTIEKIGKNEISQILNYLRVSKIKYGLILNFKHAKLEWKRIIL